MIAAMVEAEAAAAVPYVGFRAGGSFSVSATVSEGRSVETEEAEDSLSEAAEESSSKAAEDSSSEAASGITAASASGEAEAAAAAVSEGWAFGSGGCFRANISRVGVVVEAKVS